ncbi:MAG TPA: FtsX-like permease family protein [Kofleriaceae bacterium]|nr:FtsX-like permease family protein [Kofleriaceae bacterium]
MILLRYALAETRRARGTLAFCVVSIAIGVFSLTAVRGVLVGLDDSLTGQARSILGADLVLSGNRPLTGPTVDPMLADLRAAGGVEAEVTSFYTMVTPAGAGAGGERSTQLVRMRAVEGSYPPVGELASQPAGAVARLAARPSVIVDPAIRRALGVAIGDRVRVGDLEVVVAAELVRKPGTPAASFGLAPQAYLGARFLPDTGLLRTGSRIQYERMFRLPDGFDAEAWKDAHWDAALAANVTIQTSREAASSVQRFLRRLSDFLTTVGLITLLLGALGIASAMSVFLKHKLDHAAVFRCLGATSRQVGLIYGLLAVGVGGIGSLIGALLGALAPVAVGALAPRIGGDLVPADLAFGPSWLAGLRGVAVGVVVTAVFALVPVWRTAHAPPLRVLRRHVDPVRGRRRLRDLAVGLVVLSGLFAFVLALALVEIGSLQVAVYFTGAVALALALLALFARVLAWAARVIGPRLPGYHLRQGLANLHRPGNQTRSTLTAIGVGVLLVILIGVIEASLQRVIDVEDRDELPSVFLIDVQPDQKAAVEAMVTGGGGGDLQVAPMIGARIGAVAGRPVDRTGVTRDATRRTWADQMRTREYFVTFREAPIPSEKVVAGSFWRGRPARQEVSIDEYLASNLGIRLGDTLTLDIQGLPLDAVVTSFRRIEWEAMAPNAIIVMSPGPIEEAPRMYVMSFRLADEARRRALQGQLARAFPNVSAIDVTDAAETVRMILGRISAILGFLALLTIATGAVIVGGAVAAGRFARVREAMLLRVLGASRRDLRRILGVEYAALAGLGGLAGWLLAEATARPALARFFDAPLVVPYRLVAAVLVGVVILNVAVGFALSRGVASARPLDILREE